MKFLSVLTSAASVTAAALQDASKAQLDVTLQVVGNSQVKATIQNNGKEDINLLKDGSILDSSAVQKVKVATGDHSLPFLGIKKRISTKKITGSAVQHIPAGQSIEVNIDVAHAHDLSTGGKFSVNAAGSLSVVGNNGVAGSVSYTSNTIEVSVDGKEAAAARHAFTKTKKRSIVQSDCSGQRLQVTKTALSNCKKLAQAAGQAASSGSADRMEEYFKASDSRTRQEVAGVFSRVAKECGSTTSGVAEYYCTDVGNDCGGNTLAYTSPSESYMVYCDLYFDDLPAVTSQCHEQDQATTNIHEDTHLNQIQGTDDLGYGYDEIRGLSASQELNNADTFALFANAVYSDC
ncbi:hypothetical protein NLG97_g8254 [Lecanicillium saksenae]|uniref:Uncharacterized protein n=1 Tax=Lecanicillium saksenae TaxID=468837 RepID=A0ACC1QJI5_9HYPO|nr:hypothetical protein NLG97_g8254 [Lecanicillium saksenae]